jgi:hypothetical protein
MLSTDLPFSLISVIMDLLASEEMNNWEKPRWRVCLQGGDCFFGAWQQEGKWAMGWIPIPKSRKRGS